MTRVEFILQLYFDRQRNEGDEKKKNRDWTDEQMMTAIQRILNGYTYQDVKRDKLIPISTLWTRLNIFNELHVVSCLWN